MAVAAAEPTPNPWKGYLGVQQTADAEMKRALERAARDIKARIAKLDAKGTFSAQARAAQLRAVQNEIHGTMLRLWGNDVSGIVRTGRKAAAEAAQAAVDRLGDIAYAALTPDAAEALARSFKATAQAGINTAYARVPRELSARVYNNAALANKTVDQLVRSGLAQGLSAKELANSVYQYVSPTTPGGASYAAMRLARTEINNAFHEQQILAADAPGVSAVHWNLSGSHPKPDACNDLAERDGYDLGAGNYPKNNVPGKPHPHCFCYLSYVTVDPEEFVRQLHAGTYDDELRRRTQLNVERFKEQSTPRTGSAIAAKDRRVDQARITASVKPGKPVTLDPVAMTRVDPARAIIQRKVSSKSITEGLQRPGEVGRLFQASDASAGAIDGDRALLRLTQRQDFDELPGLLTDSQLDELVGQGWTEMHRGASIRQTRLFQNATGDDWAIEHGLYGNGTYFYTSPGPAGFYADELGVVARAGLRPDARTIEWNKLNKMQADHLEKFREAHPGVFGPRAEPDPRLWDQTTRDARAYVELMSDPGRFATARGYDAIEVVGEPTGWEVDGVRDHSRFFIVLNRGAVSVVRTV